MVGWLVGKRGDEAEREDVPVTAMVGGCIRSSM